MYYTLFFRLLNGHSTSGEVESSPHSHHADDFLEGSTVGIRAESRSGLEDDPQLSEASAMTRGSGGFEAFAKHRNSVSKHDDASQTDDGEFGPRGPDQTPSVNIRGVWRGEARGQDTETDSIAAGRGYQQKDEGHARGAGAERRSGNRGRTKEWVTEHVAPLIEVHYASDSPDATKPSNTDVRPKHLPAFTHVVDPPAHGSTDVTQVRNSLLYHFYISLLAKPNTGFEDSGPAGCCSYLLAPFLIIEFP